MAEVINALTDGVAYKAPAHMSGPNVHRFKQQVMAGFESEPRSIVLDFGEVDFIDLHGLVLLRDLCDIIRVYGARAFAYRMSDELREVLGQVEMIEDLGEVQSEQAAIRTA